MDENACSTLTSISRALPASGLFAWMDKFWALRIRFDRKASHFLDAHYIVYALINLRHLFAGEKSQ
ncbi:MAG: hypothetical protein K8L97_32865 [Anaerolineae bacterium]|nr:hypothetical protein [Anaerolineae bacterium]